MNKFSSFARITSADIRQALTNIHVSWTERTVHDVRLRWNSAESRWEKCFLVDLFATAEVLADALFAGGFTKEAVEVLKNSGAEQLILFHTIETRVA